MRMFCLLFLFFIICCGTAEERPVTVKWDAATAEYVGPGEYARVKLLSDGRLTMVYSHYGAVLIRFRRDGEKWTAPARICPDEDGYIHTNAELTELASGRLIYTWNARQRRGVGDLPYKITASVSDDRGETWSEPRDLYAAGSTWTTGCWEPVVLQLPSGEVQLYFANEKNTPEGDQDITMMRSFDDGDTWREPGVIAYRKGARDGMPVPVCLKDGKGIALAIEDNGIEGVFKPVIIYTTLNVNWTEGYVDGESDSRWHALAADERLGPEVYAGAPYLIQLASGHTLLAIQSGEGRNNPSDMQNSIMQVYSGNSGASDFGRRTTPFEDLPPFANGLWNSLCQIDEDTVMAVSTINGLDDMNGIWIVSGKIIPAERSGDN